MTLDDLLIYGDYYEENDINNTVYKQFLNLLRIKLRRNNRYNGSSKNGWTYGDAYGNGNGSKKCKCGYITSAYGIEDGDGYCCSFGYGFGQNGNYRGGGKSI